MIVIVIAAQAAPRIVRISLSAASIAVNRYAAQY
jgi:hypothetical protein